MTCPKCHSDDWKLASLVYKEGLTHVETKSGGGGIGISGGGIGAGVGGATTSGTHQTEISRLAAPPSGFGASCSFIIGAIIFGLLGFLFSVLWILAFGCIVGIFSTWSSDANKHAAALAKWQNLRMCQRCGTFYDFLQTPQTELATYKDSPEFQEIKQLRTRLLRNEISEKEYQEAREKIASQK